MVRISPIYGNGVTCRFRKLKDGGYSSYLDIYIGKKCRRYEFLGKELRLQPGRTREERQQNEEVMTMLRRVVLERSLEMARKRMLQKCSEHVERAKTTMSIGDLANEYLLSNKSLAIETGRRIKSLSRDLRRVMGEDMQVGEMTAEHLRQWLLDCRERGNKESSIACKLKGVRALMTYASKRGLVSGNIVEDMERQDCPHSRNREVDFLTQEEMGRLLQGDESSKKRRDVIRAFRFSCMTGLRWSDITKLTYGRVQEDKGQYWLDVVMQKTGSRLRVPITTSAKELMGEGENDRLVFDLPTLSYANQVLKELAARAGIAKNIHFHVARHTFATQALAAGVDLYTVAKLLGHSNVRVTQVYAKVMDMGLVKAVEKMRM